MKWSLSLTEMCGLISRHYHYTLSAAFVHAKARIIILTYPHKRVRLMPQDSA